MVKKLTTILTIAGTDNTSGAGIQADIKTSCILGVYCLSAVTIITSQNSKSFTQLFNVPNHILKSQLKASSEEYKIDGVKVGLVNKISTAKIIFNFLKNFKKKFQLSLIQLYNPQTKKNFVSCQSFKKFMKFFRS